MPNPYQRITYPPDLFVLNDADPQFVGSLPSALAGSTAITFAKPFIWQGNMGVSIEFTGLPITITDAGTNGGQGSVAVWDFPRHGIQSRGGSANITTSLPTGSTFTGGTGTVELGLGHIAPAADATLTGSEDGIITRDSKTSVTAVGTTFKPFAPDADTIDGVTSLKSILINMAMTDAASTTSGVLNLSGMIVVFWRSYGDKNDVNFATTIGLKRS